MPTINMEAESYMLGCILLDGSLVSECELRAEHFATGNHQAIFTAMKELEKKNQPIDLVSVHTQDRSIDIGYLSDLVGSIPSVKHFYSYQKLILSAWKLRESERIVNEFREECQDTPDESIVSDMISRLVKVDEVGYTEDFNLEEVLSELIQDLENRDGSLRGLDTGWRDLNAYTNGWHNQNLIIIGARPSVGKTVFALNTSIAACKHDVVVSAFTLEMNRKECLQRVISAVGRIDATHLRHPKRFFSQDDWDNLKFAREEVKRMKLFIHDKPSVSVQEIRSKVREAKRKYPNHAHLCVIDYLQLIQTAGKDRTREMGDVSRALKLMAREYNMPVIALSQLNRGNEGRADKRPVMSDIRESGNIEQDADVICLLHREDYYDPDSERKNIVDVFIAKQRNGPVGKVELIFLKEYNKFVDVIRT